MILFITQILFTFTRFFAKYNLIGADNFYEALKGNWLIIYLCTHVLATLMQLYVFHLTNILKAMAYFSVISLILTIFLGAFLFHEVLDLYDVISVVLVLTAVVIINHEQKQKPIQHRRS